MNQKERDTITDLTLDLISLDKAKDYIRDWFDTDRDYQDIQLFTQVKEIDVYLVGLAFYGKCISSSKLLREGELVIGFITNKSVLFEGEYHSDPDFYQDYEGWELYAYRPHPFKSVNSLESNLRLLAKSDPLSDEDLHLDEITTKYHLSVIKTF
jgi:hypothetical protein